MALKLLHVAKTADMLSRIQSQINGGHASGDATAVKSYGMESLDGNTLGAQETAIKNGISVITDVIAQGTASQGQSYAGNGLEGFSDAQIQAASIALTIGGDFQGYIGALKNNSNRAMSASDLSLVSGSRYGSANMKQGYGTEAFEQAQSFVPQQNATVEYNLKAAKQDAVGEAFFPTTTLTPNDIGLSVTVPVDIVEPFIKHKANGEVTDWQRKKLINAMRDPTILRNDAIKLIPYRPLDGSNDAQFAVGVPKFNEIQGGEEVPTGALKPGIKIGFMGLCSTPSLVQAGALEASDQIDTGARLQYIWIEVANASGTKELFKLRTDHLDRSTFQKSQEGDKFETSLDFSNITIALNDLNKTTDNTDSALLAPLVTSGQQAILALDIKGTMNHEKGSLVVNSLTNPSIIRVYDTVAKEDANTKSGALRDAIDALTITFKGYFVRANLRNSNFRTREQRVDRQTSVYKYMVQLGAPITAIAPVTDAWGPKESIAVETLSNATYARNSAMAISRLLDYVETIRDAGVTNNGLWQRYDENSIEGVGKAVVDPWYGEGSFDISKVVNGVKSSQTRDDVSEKILNILRTYAYRMNAESGYNVALQMLYNEVQPTLVIATDNIIAQYLMEVGDLRTAGISFKVHVATTNNIEMRGKIIMTLSRMKSGGLDLLTFGMHLWVPEIVATVNVMRNGTYIEETMVQPRNLHVVVCPIVANITITGLEEAYTGKITVPVDIVSEPESAGAQDLGGLNTTPATTTNPAA
ncbi:putative major capsid protein [Erwinia phage vB_EamM_RAY]|uniref:Major capsid protein n=1 Tax=Erwinia phage vB_EamM_RAY TaxID=1815987 RepID=A0A173GEL5_9CAUD|nr:major head protein [Erwinia phage vB_EamM_RAY]ANH52097.1 putative major capsid protein [Erwinia phage vB_EamM_RAY]